MSVSMYQASIPGLIRSLESLAAILDKAERYAAERGIEPAALLGARLAPDMFPLLRQVQIVSDTAKGCAARLAGIEVPGYPDDETGFAELRERLARTAAFLRGVTPAQLDGSETREVVLKMRSGELTFTGLDYLFQFVLPNFYFHFTTAYDILRHNGLAIGKRDYLGQA
ncbi:hypothetical protein EV683_10955 [Crenobacter luteus]|uniref:DUF1993 domain-containing protein n=1 Tax=Crenobacter luteus TaxID=1452487 RepID=A0A165G5E5_9NEIS|nr:DUF1993 domain-containing protein [Crenobacter luteus]KZE35154.1 hypothetical protein AVW16_05115 [Crenobacter luteus]TCP12461.1 hypothetical protein EV683_10955 [Crenobacter luteus]